MKAYDIQVGGIYEGRSGKLRRVIAIYGDKIDWRLPFANDGPRGSLASFAKWAIRRINAKPKEDQ